MSVHQAVHAGFVGQTDGFPMPTYVKPKTVIDFENPYVLPIVMGVITSSISLVTCIHNHRMKKRREEDKKMQVERRKR